MERENTKTSLLSRWKNKQKGKANSNSIKKAPENILIPLSGGQQRLWFLQQMYPKNPVYNYSECFNFKGNLKIDLLEKSLNLIIAANHALRSFYKFEKEQLIQEISSKDKIDLIKLDLSKLDQEEQDIQKQAILLSEARKCFDLDKPLLIRTILLKLSASEYILFITLHHIIFDKWSMDIFINQLSSNYSKLLSGISVEVDQLKLQFTDYAYWQQNKEIEATQLNYWEDKLGGNIPFLELPTDYTIPKQPSFKGAEHTRHLSEFLSCKVLDLAKELETTPYVLLLSVYYLLLFKYSGQTDLLIGSPISLRDQKALEDIIGFFDDTVVLRMSLSPAMSFSNLVKEVKRTTLEAFSNKDIPFDILVKKLNPSRLLRNNPFFRAMFIYHTALPCPSFGSDLEFAHSFYNAGVSKFDLTLYVVNADDRLSTSFEYATDIFSETTIIRLQDHLELLLEGIVARPNRPIAKIEMLTLKDKHFFFPEPMPQNKPFDSFEGIHQIIEAAAKKSPEAIAVTFQNTSITYASLMQKSDLLAETILNNTNGANEIIGLCVERSVSMIVGLMAILKAGCAYLPIDPEYPSKRIDYMLNDSNASIIVSQSSETVKFKNFRGTILTVDNAQDHSSNLHFQKLPIVNQDHLAYVIYTSGSTGKPKGVPITHGNIINSTEGRLNFYRGYPKSFLLMSSISFDSSKAGIFWTLCTGGNLVIAKKRLEQDLSLLGEVIATNSVSHTLMLPSIFQLVLEHSEIQNLKSLTTVIVAGEACASSLCKTYFEKLSGAALYNEYGPTEATVWSLAHQIKKEDVDGSIPIGGPVANCEIYLLNEFIELVPFGAIGEIYIGGPSLASGYLNRPELTKEVFINHPFKNDTSEKLYKTGDLGRYRNDGSIEFLGRIDKQIKIRGHRIELDEIEKVLDESPIIDKAVVLFNDSDEKQHFHDEVTEIMAYFNDYLNESEALELLDSIESLKTEEREYILHRMHQS